MSDLPDSVRTWRDGGNFVEADGVPVFHRVAGRGPWLVCFHGFPTSSWDWHRLLPLLEKHFRVLVFDFPGHGLSGKPAHRDYSLKRQFDAAEALWRHLGIEEFSLLSHDMGDTVACELLRRLELGASRCRLKSLTLLNGGLYPDLHRPLLTQRLLRTPVLGPLVARCSGWPVFRTQYARLYARPAEFTEEHYREQWALLLHNEGRRSLASVAGYMPERLRMGEQWLGPLHRCPVPLRAIWGRLDPVAPPTMTARLAAKHPALELVALDDAGHYPQLERPAEVAAALLRHLAR
ncbi:MAG: alpha/beta hydrolase [Opitutae bacterium]|nr:alpha/beta hydrolase [Opitutae bacterium]